MSNHQPIHSLALLEHLADQGVISRDERIRRVVIDARIGAAVSIYVERVGDERLLNIAPALTGVQISSVAAGGEA